MPKLISKRHLRRKAALASKLTIDKINNDSENVNAEEYASVPMHSEFRTVYCNQVNYNAEIENAELLNSNNNQISDCINYSVPFETIEFNKSSICEDIVNLNCSEQKYESDFKENLHLWALNNGVTHRCLNELITLIKPKYPFLNNDARTLLGTPKQKLNTFKLQNGEMVYFGITHNLVAKLSTEHYEQFNEIHLLINVDGIPIYNSSAIEFWPILAHCKNFIRNRTPFVVAIFCGVGKPRPLETFLREFISECQTLIAEGLCFKGKYFKIVLKAFCCDAPARAFLKQVGGHNSKQGCERCDITSIYSAEDKRRYYPAVSVYTNLRSNEDFYRNVCNQHIKGQSPLLELDIGLVSNFILDPMHLIYLGVTKRLINYWLEGKRQFKLSKTSVVNLNDNLFAIRKHIPSEFGRKIRTFKDIKRWKAVEFRFFLLYCGIKVLQNNLNTDMYKHFLLLHVAVYVLCSKALINQYLNIAKKSIQKFVEKCPLVYDKLFVVYNVHSLTHICDDVSIYGPLEDFSCFRFESYLGKLKRYVRGKNLPLSQINNRIVELSKVMNKTQKSNRAAEYIPCGITKKNDSSFSFCKKLIISSKFAISIRMPDNIVQVGDKVFLIKCICMANESYKCTGQYFKYKEDFYSYPVLSSVLGIYYVHG